MFGSKRREWSAILAAGLAILLCAGSARALEVLTPNEGGDVPSGGVHAISWTDPGSAVSFDLYYSRDNRKTWNRIAVGVTGSRHEWRVPRLARNAGSCYVKVVGRDPLRRVVAYDQSDKAFSITVVRLVSPSGKETYASGETRTISWRMFTPPRAVARVILQYTLDNGLSWRTIAVLGDASLRQYDWRIPAVSGARRRCRTRILLQDAARQTICSHTSAAWSLNTASLRPGVRAVDEGTLGRLTSLDGDLRLTFELSTALLDALVVGDVLVFGPSEKTPEGLLRKVSAITRTATQLLVDTEQASLQDILAEGTVSFHGLLSPEALARGAAALPPGVRVVAGSTGEAAQRAAEVGINAATGTFTFELDHVLYDHDKDPATTGDQVVARGSIALGIETDFKVDIGLLDGLRSADFYVKPFQYTNLDLAVGLLNLPAVDEKVTICPPTPLGTIPISVAGLTVTVVPVLTVKAGLTGSASASLGVGVEWETSSTAGVRYQDGVWTSYKQSTDPRFEWTPPHVEAGLSLKTSIEPTIELKIMSVAGPSITAQGYLKTDASFGTCTEHSLVAGINASSFFAMKILNRWDYRHDFGTFFEKEFPIYRNERCPPVPAASYAFVKAWGSRGSSAGQFIYPIWVAVDSAGNVYVTEEGNHRVQKFTSEGALLTKWGRKGGLPGEFTYPEGIAVDYADRVLVADSNMSRVQKFTSNGIFLLTWGEFGSEPGQFASPMGVALDGLGEVFVTDMYRGAVLTFSAEGGFLGRLAAPEWDGGELAFPTGIAVDAAGRVFVADYSRHAIFKYDRSGALLGSWGGEGTGPGQFLGPIGIAIDGSGAVLVVDQGNHRVQKFDAAGNFITSWGSEGARNGQFQWPAGIAIDAQGFVYVTDPGNSRVQKFAPSP